MNTLIGYAGSLRARNMSAEEKSAAVRDFALTKGLAVAVLAGLMSACFALGLDAGAPIRNAMQEAGANDSRVGACNTFVFHRYFNTIEQ